MSEEATFEKVKSIVVEQLGVDEKEVKMDAAYIDDRSEEHTSELQSP